ncbi:MAG: tetratricopeptide repeat protein [Myxococcota bacterium]|nr:tetratricopeptide repeat protein [Myxococcota bacterium]
MPPKHSTHRERFDRDPTDRRAFEALEETAFVAGHWDELVTLYERRIDALDPTDPAAERAILLHRLGRIHAERRAVPEKARAAWRASLDIDPTFRPALADLRDDALQREQWESLLQILDAEIALETNPAERGRLLALAGETWLDALGDAEQALVQFERALDVMPGDARLADYAARAAARCIRPEQTADTARPPAFAGEPDTWLAARCTEAAATDDPARLGELVREIARVEGARGNLGEALTWVDRWAASAPEPLAALRFAAELHDHLDRDGELVAALERMDPLLTRKDQAANRRRLGDHHAAHGRLDRASDAYRRAIEAAPDDVHLHEALVASLCHAGTPETLATAYRDLAEHCTEPRRTAVRDALARLLEESLGDPAGAADLLARLVDSPSPPADAHTRLESLLERTARYEELAKHLARRLETAGAAARPALLRRRAETLLDHLDDPDAAAATYRQLLEAAPEEDDARVGLERALRAARDLPGLVDFLAAQAGRLSNSAARDLLDVERAEILGEELGRNREAVEILDRLFREAESSAVRRDAAERLETLLERTNDREALCAHWQAWLDAGPGPEAVALHEKLGAFSLEQGQDPETAAQHFEAAARLMPERVDLWQVLARIYEAAHRPADLVRVLEAALANGDDPEQERSLSSRIAALCTSALGDPERARRHYERLITLDPDNAAAHEFLIARWEEEGHPHKVVRLLERQLEALAAQPLNDAEPWTAQRTSLRLRIAAIRANDLEDTDGAIAVLEPGLGEVGVLAVVAEPLATLYRRAGYSSDLAALCANAAKAGPAGPERATWLKRLGDTLRERGDLRGASDAYRSALEARPGDVATEAALRAVCRTLGDTVSLADLLEIQLARLNGPDEIPVRLELAALRRDQLGQPDKALAEFRRVVWLDPGHPKALAAGLDLAEQLARSAVAGELLDIALARPLATSFRADLLERRGRLRAAQSDQAQLAGEDFRGCLEIDPSRATVWAALRDLRASQQDWRDALACRLAEARLTTGEERLAHLEAGAEVAWRELSPADALPWLERLRQAAPGRLDVLERIAAAHGANGRHRSRLHALESLAERTTDAAKRRDLWCECARLLEHELGYPGRAARSLEKARQLFPDDPEILCALDRLYANSDRHRERGETLQARAARATGEARIPLLVEAAQLYADRLGESRSAAALLLQAVAETPPKDALRRDLLRLLGDALRDAGPPEAWARCAEAELASLAGGGAVFDERRGALRGELAEGYHRAARPEAALPHLRALVDASPPGAAPNDAREAELLEALGDTGNSVELERRLAIRLERTGGDAEAWLKLGRVREQRLSATGAAADAYRRALEFEPQAHAALTALRGCAEQLGRWDEVVATLDAELETLEASATERRAALLRERGDVQWRRLGSTTQASLAYAAAIEACPEDLESLRSLQRLLEAMEDWQGASDLYESEVATLGHRDAERRFAVWLRTGDIARDHLEDMDRAVRAFQKAADIAPLPLERQRETAEYSIASGDLETFAEVFSNWCDAPGSPAEPADHLRLAESWEALGFTDRARDRVAQALTLETGNPRAWRFAARLHEAAGDRSEAAEAWRHAAETTPGPEAAEAWCRAAALNPCSEALALLRQAAASDPGAWAVQSELARTALQAEQWREAETAAARALSSGDADPPEPAAVRDIALAGAQAARARGRDDRAVDFFERALAADPDCLEALAGAGECCLQLGEPERARERLAKQIAQSDHASPRLLALLGNCLAETGQPEAALERCEEALAQDPALEAAHRLCLSLHESAGRVDAGVAALERWAAQQSAGTRSPLLLRAGEWELDAGDRDAPAEAHFRAALQADPGQARAWQRLAEVLSKHGRHAEALAAAEAGLGAANMDGCDRGALERRRAHALEATGDPRSATEAFRSASRIDPNCFEAVAASARLLRAAGDWRGAAEALDHFARNADRADPVDLVCALEQLGGLLAGPLEDPMGAARAYRRALELAPEHAELSLRLADLLAHKAETRRDALALYAGILEREPARPDVLVRTLELARALGHAAGIETGCALLMALGAPVSPAPGTGTDRLGFPIAPDARLHEPLGEALRRAVALVSREIGRALRAPTKLPTPEDDGERVTRFRSTALAIEGELTAPGLLPLPASDLRSLVCCVATLALSPASARAPAATLNALAGAIGRRAKRRLRRTLADTDLTAIFAYDFDRWQRELRALAAARAVDRLGGDLQTALEAILADSTQGEAVHGDGARDFNARVAACPEACALVGRAVRSWISALGAEAASADGRRA